LNSFTYTNVLKFKLKVNQEDRQLQQRREMIFSRRVLVLALTLVAGATAIYQDDHWLYSTKLTTSNYAETIQSEIDNDKTVFVRFVASEG